MDMIKQNTKITFHVNASLFVTNASTAFYQDWAIVANDEKGKLSELIVASLFSRLQPLLLKAIKGSPAASQIEYPKGSNDTYDVIFTPCAGGCLVIVENSFRGASNDVKSLALAQDSQGSSEMLDFVLDVIDQGITVFDQHLKLIKWNRKFVELNVVKRSNVKHGIAMLDLYQEYQGQGILGIGDPILLVSGNQSANDKNKTCYTADIKLSSSQIVEAHRYYLPDGGFCITFKDVTDMRLKQECIEHQQQYDALTDIPNRQRLISKLQEYIDTPRVSQFYLFYLDINNFKYINDRFGQSIGDQLLKSYAFRLNEFIGEHEDDFVARSGGDQFYVVIRHVPMNGHLNKLTQALIDHLTQPYEFDGRSLVISVSVGVASYPDHGMNASDLIANADVAIFKAQNNKTIAYCVYDKAMGEKVYRHHQLSNEMRLDANHMKNFYLVYQPVVKLHSQEVVSVEALLRWKNDTLGMISPAEFIQIAEETGLIIKLGQYAFEEALKALSQMQHAKPDMNISINVSPIQLQDHTFSEKVFRLAQEYEVKPEFITIEVTESVIMDDIEEISHNIKDLRRYGFHLSIDDFGTGYSSLSYIQKHPFSNLKIDRSFVSELLHNDKQASIIQSVIQMAKSLSLNVIAEGIEHLGQHDRLMHYECMYGQGFLYGQGVSVDSICEELLKK